jgi:cysteine desulfurase family protein (TIGR01976 family)
LNNPASAAFPIDWVRQSFPALHQDKDYIFFDNGAGAQIPQAALDRVRDHLVRHNVQRGGRYSKSQEVDVAIQSARESVADLLNAYSADEIAFGMNATSFIRIVSLALAEILGDRREIIVTDMDHEANVATWLALEARGASIRWWNMRDDGLLHTEDLQPLLNERTRLVACTLASNTTGSIVDVKRASQMAHAVGAELFLDAVHFAPHGVLDVRDLDCDYLVCSGYKAFSPHMGFLWGKQAALEALPTFREDFIPDRPPFKIEVGTFVYENVAGMDAAIGYLEQLGERMGANGGSRRERLVRAMQSIREYETGLSSRLLQGLATIENITVYGISDLANLSRRVPTISFNVGKLTSSDVASRCGERHIAVRDGNMYSPRLLKRLGIPPEQGAVRASMAHYNTVGEVDRLVDLLRTFR